MIPETLTESQENLPDLTTTQLRDIGYENNHLWKLNAKMLGYQEGDDIDDFIDTIANNKIKSFKKGKQVAIFLFEGTKDNLDDFPLAIEGDHIIQQKYELLNGAWQELDIFSYKPDLKCITTIILPFGLTGNFSILYAKTLETAASSLSSYDYQKSCENITNTLKDIDRKEREKEFISANNLQTKNPPMKNGSTKYRITSTNKGVRH